MKQTLIFALFLFCLQACTKQEVIFNKQNNLTTVSLQLTDTSFIQIANSPEGVGFNEVGKYIIQDTFLILDYYYDSFSYECITTPLTKDTFLISHIESEVFLFPIHSQHGNARHFTYEEIMESLVKLHNTNRVPKVLKNDFLWINKKVWEQKFGKRKNIISEYYDKQLNK